jgi:hypothetical protein
VRPREAEASLQMHAKGVLALPVGTQAQVSRTGLRIAERTMFMVPPCTVRAGAPGASARSADLQGQHESSVREGMSLGAFCNRRLTRSNHRSYAGMSGKEVVDSQAKGRVPERSFQHKERSPDARRFLCGIVAHKLCCFSSGR